MLSPNSLRSFLKSKHVTQKPVIKFCYFLIAFLLIACGNETKTKAEPQDTVSSTESSDSSSKSTKKSIVCFGDSITAGYGLEDTANAYPALLQNKIDSLGLAYTVVNSGLSGETSAGGRSRIDWILRQDVDIFLLELGANDGLRGVPLTETRANLQAIIDAVKAKDPNIIIILAGMELPPNMGQDYTSEFRTVFADLAKANELAFIPFILKDVGGIPELNQSDGIHPNIEGHKIVAKNVWEVLATELQ